MFTSLIIVLAADIIMANEHTIDGRLVDVKRALPRDQAPGPARCLSRDSNTTLISLT